MSVAAMFKETDEKTEMTTENCNDEDKRNNLGLCMSAGIKTPGNSDQSRFQKRHFPNKTTSNIFFSEEDNVSLENSADRDDSFISAGIETCNADQKQSERRHFYMSEDFIQPESNVNEEDQVDSTGTSESVEMEIDNADEKPTQRRHFHDKTSSNIFFCGLPPEDNTLMERANHSDFRKRKG